MRRFEVGLYVFLFDKMPVGKKWCISIALQTDNSGVCYNLLTHI